MPCTPPPPQPDGRTRYVYQRWLRKSDGPLLTKPPPLGVRASNELIWGHNLEDFCWIERIPGADVLTIWSRSMIKEYGENYDEGEFQEPDDAQVPRMRHPWPVLKIPNDDIRVRKDAWGVIDQGCEAHARPEYAPKRRDDPADSSDQVEDNATKVAALVKKLFGFDDGRDVFTLNDPHYPLRSPEGNIYAFLFKSRIRHSFLSVRGDLPPATIQIPQLTSFTQIDGELIGIQIDEYGVEVMGDHAGRFAGLCEAPEQMSADDEISHNVEGEVDELSKHVEGQIHLDDVLEGMDDLPSDKKIPYDSPFSRKDIPKLEEDLPKYYFPDILYVHDPHKVTSTSHRTYADASSTKFPPNATMTYKRMYPELPRDHAKDRDQPTSPPREAHLHLAHQNRLGVGNHSLVHDAPLTLPTPLSAHSRNGTVRVAAKSAFPRVSARELLANEAKMYNLFPDHLSQDWCGYNLVTPVRHPVPVGPVVPKFFGYYVPVVNGMPCSATDVNAPSPILLIEQCGEDINPREFNRDDKSECYSLMLRLHYDGFTQGSFYVRNILTQPGPLTAPPDRRSKKTPSFRVIDFGRGVEFRQFIGSRSDKDRVERKQREWANIIDDEDQRAQRELRISDFDY